MNLISREELLKAGVQHGHKARKWHPKVKPFLFMKKDGVHIINVDKTQECLHIAAMEIAKMIHGGKKVLFLGRKKQVKDIIEEAALKLEQPYVVDRWLGGALTNFVTIKKLLKQFLNMQNKEQDATFIHLTKKERLIIERKEKKMGVLLRGISDLKRPPAALFVADVKREITAIKEANKMGIPVFGVVDTNADPNLVDYPIPANDDARSSMKIIVSYIQSVVQQYSLESKAGVLEENKETIVAPASFKVKKGLEGQSGAKVKVAEKVKEKAEGADAAACQEKKKANSQKEAKPAKESLDAKKAVQKKAVTEKKAIKEKSDPQKEVLKDKKKARKDHPSADHAEKKVKDKKKESKAEKKTTAKAIAKKQEAGSAEAVVQDPEVKKGAKAKGARSSKAGTKKGKAEESSEKK